MNIKETIKNILTKKDGRFQLKKLTTNFSEQSITESSSYFNSLIDSIESKQLTPSSCGTHKTCYTFPLHVVLKGIYKDPIKFAKNFSLKQKGINKLRELGIQTPKLSFFTTRNVSDTKSQTDSQIGYEIQDRVKGSPLAFFNYDDFMTYAKNSYPNLQCLDDSSYLDDKILQYNLHMQKLFLKTPLKQKNDFINQYRKLTTLDISNDFHEENILFSKDSGFWFIDLDNTEALADLSAEDLSDRLKDRSLDYRFLSNLFYDTIGFNCTAENSLPVMLYNNLIVNQLLSTPNIDNLDFDLDTCTRVRINNVKDNFYPCLSNEMTENIYIALKQNNMDMLYHICPEFENNPEYLEYLDREFFISAYENLHKPHKMNDVSEDVEFIDNPNSSSDDTKFDSLIQDNLDILDIN